MIVLQAKDIVHSYDLKNNVLKGISLSVEEKDFVSIFGASGSGKTTLLSILAGIEKPTSGQVLYGETDITQLHERALAKMRRSNVSFVYQFFNLAPYLTVEENILLPILLSGKRKSAVKDRLKELMDFLKISQYKNKLPSEISGGEQQRVAIGRGLIYQPKILFLDEPTGNLDSENTTSIMKLLADINKTYGTTIIQVTHNAENAKYGNRVLTIKDGLIN